MLSWFQQSRWGNKCNTRCLSKTPPSHASSVTCVSGWNKKWVYLSTDTRMHVWNTSHGRLKTVGEAPNDWLQQHQLRLMVTFQDFWRVKVNDASLAPPAHTEPDLISKTGGGNAAGRKVSETWMQLGILQHWQMKQGNKQGEELELASTQSLIV